MFSLKTYLNSTQCLDGEIRDYAARHYSGLTDYYKQRWAFFFDFAGRYGCSEENLAGFDRLVLENVEQRYGKEYPPAQVIPEPNFWDVTLTAFKKYCPIIWPSSSLC